MTIYELLSVIAFLFSISVPIYLIQDNYRRNRRFEKTWGEFDKKNHEHIHSFRLPTYDDNKL